MLTQSKLKELLHYSPDTGVFIWVSDCNNNIKIGELAGCVNPSGYVNIVIFGRSYKAHRLSWLFMTGVFPSDQIDHINRVRYDNRWSNLRSVSRLENSRNKNLYIKNKSGVSGVCPPKGKVKKWRTFITVNTVQIHLGYFVDRFEAICARKSAEIKYNYREIIGGDCK